MYFNFDDDQETCSCCKKSYSFQHMIYGPDPYNQEIFGDNKPVWLCRNCHRELCLDV